MGWFKYGRFERNARIFFSKKKEGEAFTEPRSRRERRSMDSDGRRKGEENVIRSGPSTGEGRGQRGQLESRFRPWSGGGGSMTARALKKEVYMRYL